MTFAAYPSLAGRTVFVSGGATYGEPEEMADAVAFLAGPRSKYISGQVLRVDGGETLFPG